MRAFEGVGIAANQVGIAKRIAVVQVEKDRSEPIVLINPKIVRQSDEVETSEEGCLSIPELFGDVERSVSVVFDALDYYGQTYRMEVSDFQARAVQHEIDHLDGILFIDRLSAVRRSLLLAKWKKLRKGKTGNTREPPDEG